MWASWLEANPREIPEYMQEFLGVGVQMALSTTYDGSVYDDRMDSARGRRGWGGEPDTVYRKRYRCKNCNWTHPSRGPSQGSARYGAPTVDLILALSVERSPCQVEEWTAPMEMQASSDAMLDNIRVFADAGELSPWAPDAAYSFSRNR